MLLLDESADEKAGGASAGAGRQYNGRLGKVEMSQVGVFLAYANLHVEPGLWSWVDGELFLPEAWFEQGSGETTSGAGHSRGTCGFKTKIELGWEMIRAGAQANGLSFEVVACDCLYGRSGWLRAQLREAELTYMAEVPCDTQVYLQEPVVKGATPALLTGSTAVTVSRVIRSSGRHRKELARGPGDALAEAVGYEPRNGVNYATALRHAGCGPLTMISTSSSTGW